MDVSVIIVNYNTEKLILDCLDSLYAKTEGLSFEVLVVDNASPVRPTLLPDDRRLTFLPSPENLGFGRANNLGASHARGKYLFCLNPDTLLMNNAVKELFDFMEGHPEAGVCGANLYKADQTPGHSYEMREPGILQELINSRSCTMTRFNEDFNAGTAPKEVPHVVGAALMISKALFDRIGGFDKDFFMYLEETYLCYQVRQLGYRIYNVPTSRIIHLEGQSFTLRTHYEDFLFDARRTYYTKRYGRAYYHLSNLPYALNALANFLYLRLRGKKNEAQIWRYRLQKVGQPAKPSAK
ncbi:glycosyltransferase family 2 protein [Phocaeicola sp.]|uniref:glycosyltransferase family 2 protein n=1 Tax=Phocaeicola sp. TaxID=2773926 RepID=UPI00284E5254|nr:glycosyltransferase family 2 protein [Phocaeicola sp.]MDR3794880.1 glycosyltransferase family 2 protein [Phocaeicola sp.]